METMYQINEFYRFQSQMIKSSFHACLDEVYDHELDSERKLLMGLYDGFSFPVLFKQSTDFGNKLCDIIGTGTAYLYLISENIKKVLEVNKLRGWKTFELELLDKKGNEIRGYHGLSITGRCGPIDYEKSEIFEKQTVPNGPVTKYYKGLHVGLDKWDGTDFFLPEGNLGIIITKKAADIIKKNKLTNIDLTNLEDWNAPEYCIK